MEYRKLFLHKISTVGDFMKCTEKLKVFLCGFLSLVICLFSCVCVKNRVFSCFDVKGDIITAATFSVFPNYKREQTQTDNEKTRLDNAKKNKDRDSSEKQAETVKNSPSKKDEVTYPINEMHLNSGDFSYDNFQIKNTTSYDMDVESLLNSDLPFDFKDTRQAQVLIVHTHSCESYMDSDEGYYSESFYPRTTDNEKNVVAVGKVIADTLKENSIGVIHATTQHDNPSYDGAYSRSYDTIMSYLEKYSEIKVVLDIHRDSMTADNMTKIKPTFEYKGKKASQIMIMTGHNTDGSFETWEDNLKFALKLQSQCETMYEGMTRPLYFGDFTYNMNVNSGSLLIEVGTDANTLEESLRTGKMLGNALSKVLQNS